MTSATPKGIWGRTVTTKQGGVGVWDQLSSDLVNAEQLTDSKESFPSIWDFLSQTPGGLWNQLGEETIVHEPTIEGVWSEALEETLILDRGSANVWRRASDESLILDGQSDIELWQQIGDETIILSPPKESIWEKAQGTPEFIDLRPTRRLGYAIKRFATSRGEIYYILKNIRQGTYLRLNDQQLYIWNMLNGEYTVQDIAVAYMAEYGNLDISILVDLLKKLEAGNFLTSITDNIYDQVRINIYGKGIKHYVLKVVGSFFKKEFPIKNVDAFYTKAYNGGVKYLYKLPVQIVFLIVGILGTGAFLYLLFSHKYSLIHGGAANIPLGLFMLYVARTLALVIHEGGHAFTCKHYGREVRKSGVMIYYGMLAFYVDTTDIWLEKRLPRIMVSFGGPYTGFVIGGFASMIALLSPIVALNGWMYQLAFMVITDSVLNLNPLLKWDGYYVLMDLLEVPNLRTRSLRFLKSGKPLTKFIKRQKFNRDERILTIYGGLTAVYTASILIAILIFFGSTLLGFVIILLNPFILLPVLIVLFLYFNRRRIVRRFRDIRSRRILRSRS